MLISSLPLYTSPLGFKWGDARRGGDEINVILLTRYIHMYIFFTTVTQIKPL